MWRGLVIRPGRCSCSLRNTWYPSVRFYSRKIDDTEHETETKTNDDSINRSAKHVISSKPRDGFKDRIHGDELTAVNHRDEDEDDETRVHEFEDASDDDDEEEEETRDSEFKEPSDEHDDETGDIDARLTEKKGFGYNRSEARPLSKLKKLEPYQKFVTLEYDIPESEMFGQWDQEDYTDEYYPLIDLRPDPPKINRFVEYESVIQKDSQLLKKKDKQPSIGELMLDISNDKLDNEKYLAAAPVLLNSHLLMDNKYLQKLPESYKMEFAYITYLLLQKMPTRMFWHFAAQINEMKLLMYVKEKHDMLKAKINKLATEIDEQYRKQRRIPPKEKVDELQAMRLLSAGWVKDENYDIELAMWTIKSQGLQFVSEEVTFERLEPYVHALHLVPFEYFVQNWTILRSKKRYAAHMMMNERNPRFYPKSHPPHPKDFVFRRNQEETEVRRAETVFSPEEYKYLYNQYGRNSILSRDEKLYVNLQKELKIPRAMKKDKNFENYGVFLNEDDEKIQRKKDKYLARLNGESVSDESDMDNDGNFLLYDEKEKDNPPPKPRNLTLDRNSASYYLKSKVTNRGVLNSDMIKSSKCELLGCGDFMEVPPWLQKPEHDPISLEDRETFSQKLVITNLPGDIDVEKIMDLVEPGQDAVLSIEFFKDPWIRMQSELQDVGPFLRDHSNEDLLEARYGKKALVKRFAVLRKLNKSMRMNYRLLFNSFPAIFKMENMTREKLQDRYRYWEYPDSDEEHWERDLAFTPTVPTQSLPMSPIFAIVNFHLHFPMRQVLLDPSTRTFGIKLQNRLCGFTDKLPRVVSFRSPWRNQSIDIQEALAPFLGNYPVSPEVVDIGPEGVVQAFFQSHEQAYQMFKELYTPCTNQGIFVSLMLDYFVTSHQIKRKLRDS